MVWWDLLASQEQTFITRLDFDSLEKKKKRVQIYEFAQQWQTKMKLPHPPGLEGKSASK